jgi:imidazole glycerol-phosphate synthase subunit HisH
VKVGIMDYKAGNIRSVETALRHLDAACLVSDRPETLAACDRLIIPGDGEALAIMSVLRETGLDQVIRDFFRSGRPILGICIGCQIVLERSEERAAECLGLIPGQVLRFPRRKGFKVPHMGWNQVVAAAQGARASGGAGGRHPIFGGIPDGAACYFVHSYYPAPSSVGHAIAFTDYGLEFASAVARDNLTALQFHPEKSGRWGLKMLENFLSD